MPSKARAALVAAVLAGSATAALAQDAAAAAPQIHAHRGGTVVNGKPTYGEVRSFTLAALRRCKPDVLGSPGGGLRTRTVKPRGSIPTIAEVLELARLTGSAVNLEIKNVPTDPDYDATSAYAQRVMNIVLASGLPSRQLLIQSFIPANLDVAKQRMPRVATSLLTLPASPTEIGVARDNGY